MADPTGEYKAREVATAVRAARGVVEQAAEALGCTPRTVYHYADRYVTVERALDESRLDVAAEAEERLIAMMRDEDHPRHYKAVKDVLRNYHPDNWTDERSEQEHGGAGDEPPVVVFEPDTPEPDGADG